MPLSCLAFRGTGKSGRSIGRREPSYTGTFAPMTSKTRNEFSVHTSTGTLPFTVVAATSLRSGCNAANRRATASSVPVSTSRMSFVGTDVRPLPATRSERDTVWLHDTRLWIMRDEHPARGVTIGVHPANRLKARNDTKPERAGGGDGCADIRMLSELASLKVMSHTSAAPPSVPARGHALHVSQRVHIRCSG